MPVFHEVRAPTRAAAGPTQLDHQALSMKLLTRKGYLIEEQGMTTLAATSPDTAARAPASGGLHLPHCAWAPGGAESAEPANPVPSQAAPPTEQRCVNEQGFSLHAEVCCAAHQRKKLEHLCRYITRPAVANAKPDTWTYRCQLLRTERLTLNRAGQGVLALKTPYRDVAPRVHAATRRAGSPSAVASDPLPWCARAQSQAPPWAWLSGRAGQLE